MKKKRIVVIGGGTGSFVLLTGLKRYRNFDLTAVVSMADDGGSTGILRDELGVLPPGDVRQCLVALSKADTLMRRMMNYRFTQGKLKGHSFGNLLISVLEKITGSFDIAVEKASEILRLRGKVVPATLQSVHLVARLTNGRAIRGQQRIYSSSLRGLESLTLDPPARANAHALSAIHSADLIVIGPGDLYSSIVPVFLIRGIAPAIRKSKAKTVFVSNLMTKQGQTDGFTVHDFTRVISRYVGKAPGIVLYNNKIPRTAIIRRYAQEGEYAVPPLTHQEQEKKSGTKFIGGNIVNPKVAKPQPGDAVRRSFIRHDPDRLARAIVRLIKK